MRSLSTAVAITLLKSAGAAKRPHIVFFLSDDYGWADVSYHGVEANDTNIIDTPCFDALASNGIRLENYYVNPVCSPTRASIMTGRYTLSHGIQLALVDSAPAGLALEEVTLAQKMREAGYATHAVGKWHLGFNTWAHTPQERGFDSFYGFYAGSTDYWSRDSLCWAGSFDDGCFSKENNGTAVTGMDLHSNRVPVGDRRGTYSTNLFTEQAQDVIRGHASQHADDGVPLFLYLAHQAVHDGNAPDGIHPYWEMQAPDDWIEKYAWVKDEYRRNYSAMVSVMDQSAGNVTATLRELGMWEDTVFIMSTDNGGPTNKGANNYPFRGGKASVWEGGVRGVGFVAGGDLARFGASAQGYQNRQLLHVADWLPTLCELAGCRMNGTLPLDGLPMWKSIARNETSDRTEIAFWKDTQVAVRLGDYKIVSGQSGGPHGGKDAQLFNVVADASESHDLAAEMPEKLEELQQRVAYWRAREQKRHDVAMPEMAANPSLHGGFWEPWRGEDASFAHIV